MAFGWRSAFSAAIKPTLRGLLAPEVPLIGMIGKLRRKIQNFLPNLRRSRIMISRCHGTWLHSSQL